MRSLPFSTIYPKPWYYTESMAGDGIGNPAKCLHYGYLFQHLSRVRLEMVFWAIFLLGILCLIISGIAWADSEKIGKEVKDAEASVRRGHRRNDLPELYDELMKRQYTTVIITSVAAPSSIVCTVFQAMALLALEYCEGEDLIQLYWGFWSLIQVGASIALTGLAIYHIYKFNDHDHPPWMIALGTPVLVIAGLGHLLVLSIVSLFKRRKGRQDSLPTKEPQGRSYSDIPLQKRNAYGAYITGFSPAGEPYICFPNGENRPMAPPGAQMLDFDPVSGAALFKYPAPRGAHTRPVVTRQTTDPEKVNENGTTTQQSKSSNSE